MAIRPKNEVLNSIKQRERIVNGAKYTIFDAFCGKNVLTKKPIRLFASTKKELLTKIDEFYDAHSSAGDLASSLSASELMDAKMAMSILIDAGLKVSLTECAQREIDRAKSISAHDTEIGKAWDEYLSSKRDGEDKCKAERTTGKWVAMVGRDRMLSTIAMKDITEYLLTHYANLAPKTYNSHLAYINTFLNWCAKDERLYILVNPAKTIPYKTIEWKEPEYMKPDTVERIFRILEKAKEEHPDYLAFAINGFFCGIRRAETNRMAELDDAAKIHLDDATVRIAKGKGYTNGRRPRAFAIPDNALAWMKSFDYEKAVQEITPNTLQNMMRFLAAHGVKWFHNCARHTFITMHVAAYGDPAKTQAMCGTSGAMLCNNYRGLASKKEGEEHFSIYPTFCSSSCDTSSSATPAL